MLENLRNKALWASWSSFPRPSSAWPASLGRPCSRRSPSPGPAERIEQTVQDKIVGYAAPTAAALVAVGLAYVVVKCIPR